MHHGPVSPEIAAGLLVLRERIAAAKIPPSKLDELINIAVWIPIGALIGVLGVASFSFPDVAIERATPSGPTDAVIVDGGLIA